MLYYFLPLIILSFGIIEAMEIPSSSLQKSQLASPDNVREELGDDFCNKLLQAWTPYERKVLATILTQKPWPSARKGGPIYFAHDKEARPESVSQVLDNKKVSITMEDFVALTELHEVPKFENYSKEILKFDDLRHTFASDDEIWEKLNWQLTKENS